MLIIDDNCEECFEPGTEDNLVVKAYDYRYGDSLAVHAACAQRCGYEVLQENYDKPVSLEDQVTRLTEALAKVAEELHAVVERTPGCAIDDSGEVVWFT